MGYDLSTRNPRGLSRRELQAERYAERRSLLRGIKLLLGCAECGYDERAEALDFDHGSVKTFDIGKYGGYSYDRIFDEIAGCAVLCANCHRVKTADRRANG